MAEARLKSVTRVPVDTVPAGKSSDKGIRSDHTLHMQRMIII